MKYKYIYSIIIPHKNIPQLLERCLASIPLRDDLEVIIVDDNSAPNIVDFENFPGKNRSNTTVVFDKSGKGAGRARNVGLKYATGKWLLFADADDFFTYCFRDVLDEYAVDNSDVVFFNASSIDSEVYTNANRVEHINRFIDNYLADCDKGEYELRYVHGSPWAKLIRSELVSLNQISFQETKIHNDTRFSYLIGYYAKAIKADRRAIYCVTYRNNSISYTLSEEKIIDRMKVFAEKYRFFLERRLPLTNDDWWIDDLVHMRKVNNIHLYEICIQLFVNQGIERNVIENKVIAKEQYQLAEEKRAKRNRRFIVISNLIKKLYHRIVSFISG